MPFTISQIQNVLRTYQSLLKHKTSAKSEQTADSFDGRPVQDTVTISDEARKRLKQNQPDSHHRSSKR